MANIFVRKLFDRKLLTLLEPISACHYNTCTYFPLKRLELGCSNQSSNLTFNKQRFRQVVHVSLRDYSVQDGKGTDKPAQKLSLFQRFKQMYKEYWYVLIPVHLVTSTFWFGGFYYLAKSGVDVAAILESMHVSEKITSSLKDSSMGYIAVAYALYKISTPARYTVTLAGTTVSINYLKKWGYIKPVPSKEQLKEMYKMKKGNWVESVLETKEKLKPETLKHTVETVKDKKDTSKK